MYGQFYWRIFKVKVPHLYSAANRICRLSGAFRHRQGRRSALAAGTLTCSQYVALVYRFRGLRPLIHVG